MTLSVSVALLLLISTQVVSLHALDVSSACPLLLTSSSVKNYKRPSNDTLLVVVPWKVDFEQFVHFNPETCFFDGFSIQVFLQALSHMQPHNPFPYRFVLHGDGEQAPSYEKMIDMVVEGDVDAVVADLTMTRERMEKVAFTMPYLPSALIMVTPFRFTSLCVFQAQEESVRTHLGRFVTVVWLFVMLIFNSSYTASLASLLSAQKMYPSIEGFKALLSDKNISIGYQAGSFMREYMNKIHIEQDRLRNISSEKGYLNALKEGNGKPDGVGAVLAELPYVQILLQSECFFTKSPADDDLPSWGGFAFAFHKNSTAVVEISKMIVAMQEDKTLQRLQNGWGIGGAKSDSCSSVQEPSYLRLRSFGGLFCVLCGVYVFSVAWRLSTKALRSNKECATSGCNACRGMLFSRRSNRVTHGSFEDSDVSL